MPACWREAGWARGPGLGGGDSLAGGFGVGAGADSARPPAAPAALTARASKGTRFLLLRMVTSWRRRQTYHRFRREKIDAGPWAFESGRMPRPPRHLAWIAAAWLGLFGTAGAER